MPHLLYIYYLARQVIIEATPISPLIWVEFHASCKTIIH